MVLPLRDPPNQRHHETGLMIFMRRRARPLRGAPRRHALVP